MRDFCGFTKVPDASLMSRFKHDFEPYIEQMFQQMVDYTEPICQLIDSTLAGMLTFDTSGIELYVTENNPKTLNSLIKKLKAYYKGNPDVDPYKMAYGIMPSQAASCSDAKQMYINGHFCYADKFAILTNGLGIVRHISFTDDDDFKSSHPDMIVEKKTDSPDEDKSVGDASALVPVLTDFFALHPDFHPDVFLGDSSFDSAELYGSLINDFHFSKTLIPYNPRNESTLKKVGYNEYGYPTCPNDPSLAMKYHGATIEKGRAKRIKWGCPKMHYHKGWICDCETPCSTAAKGRTTYTYENMELRMFPGIQRDSKEWNDTYKIRAIVERTINHFKINMCIAKSHYYKSGCVPGRHCQPINSDCCLLNELSTIYSKLKTFSCLKKIFNCRNSYLGLIKYAQNLMIYVNSETILNNDLFFSLYKGKLSTVTDKNIFQLPIPN